MLAIKVILALIPVSLAQWGISNLDFHSTLRQTSPAATLSYGTVSFNVTNYDARATTICTWTDTRQPLYFFGDSWFDCGFPERRSGPTIVPALPEVGRTYFKFANTSVTTINIYQTWTANSGGSLYVNATRFVSDDANIWRRTTYIGFGNATVKLSCESSSYQNPNWTIGQDYFRYDNRCDRLSFNMTYARLNTIQG